MPIGEWFGWGTGNDKPLDELPLIFPLDFKEDDFVEIDVINIYQKILTDVFERCQGLKEEQNELLWDNCVQSEAEHGLISLLARSMAFKRKLYLVYDKALNVLRLANPEEQKQIEVDYAKQGRSNLGVFFSFTHYLKSDLIRLYSALEYLTIGSLHKQMNLSTAIQLKMNDLRQSTGLIDAAAVKAQAQKIAKALGDGRDVLMDAKDVIENSVPDLTAVQTALIYLAEKRSFYLGMPASYVTGQQTTGIGTTGEADTKGVERGLKTYFYSIAKPVIKALFDIELTYKSQDFRMINEAMNALKTFAVTGTEIVSLENQTLVMNRLLDLPEDEEGDKQPEGTLTPEQIGQNNAFPVI